MTKNKKIIFSVLAVLLLIYFLPIFGLEKSVIKNEISKSTWEPVLGKTPLTHFVKEIVVNKKIDFLDEKNVSQYITDENISKFKKENSKIIIFEGLDYSDINSSEIKKIGVVPEYSYYDFIQNGGDAVYFKPDFTKFFQNEVGDEITFIINNEEYTGFITEKKIEKEDGNTSYKLTINPTMTSCSVDNDCEISIDIFGSIFNNGEIHFSGSINYSEINGGVNYEFKTNNKLGILVPTVEYEMFLGPIDFD